MDEQLKSVTQNSKTYAPDEEFTRQATIDSGKREAMLAEAAADHVGFWKNLAESELDWIEPFSKGLDDSQAPFFKWFADGKINASANCLDANLKANGDKIAIIAEYDDGSTRTLSYQQLHAAVCRFANALKNVGVARGERVLIYMPMVPEAVIAMQACARIGAVHSVVFGGFSARSIYDRAVDAGATAVITANQGKRGGKSIELKKAVDEALELGEHPVKKVIVFKRTDAQVPMTDGRDLWWHDAEAGMSDSCAPEPMDAEDALFILYTSGSTGKPKGIQHATGGYLLWTKLTCKWVFDIKPDDIFWCTADVGWITGHSYICYGPMLAGATQMIFEGVPTHPDASRFWQMVAKHKPTIFYTAPTAIRTLAKLGHDLPGKHDLSSLRLLGTVGEPINPEAWRWFHEQVGGGRCPIVDTWWQTETGGASIAPLPGAVAAKPGSCTLPLPGMDAAVIDENGDEKPRGEPGILAIRKPWPSMLRTIWGDPDRFRKTYFPSEIAGGRYYIAGDNAVRDEDGYFWILGRLDDVLNVSGHRIGTMEVESALVASPEVAEAAVVGRPDATTGEAIVAFVVPQNEVPQGEDAKALSASLRDWVKKEIGAIAKPTEIRFGGNLPKTRSGKIMRRLLRSIAKGEEIAQDTTTLENPQILEQFKKDN